jgi:hypothetical protein
MQSVDSVSATDTSATAGVADPAASVIEGPAFPVSTKLLAGLLMALLVYWSMRWAFAAGALQGGAAPGTLPQSLMVFGALAMLFYIYYWMLISRTRMDAQAIVQTWFMEKRVPLSGITQARLVCIPYLEWLVAPRIVVRVRGKGSYVLYAADRQLWAAFARLSLGAGPGPSAGV